ncbi:MAG: hypothetical protein JWO80_219, partial [Bryobacterales bacterium]|nr:hypothetical protein [Bryobacterales bacterium]
MSYTQPIVVTLDPRSAATAVDLARQLDLAQQACEAMRRDAELVTQVRGLKTRLATLKGKTEDTGVTALAVTLDGELDKVLGDERGIGARLSAVLGVADSADRVPPAQAYAIYQEAAQGLGALTARWQKLQATEVDALDGQLRIMNIPALVR